MGPGRLLVSAIDLEKADATVVGKQLRRSLLDYAAGEDFSPTVKLTPEQARKLFTVARVAPKEAPAARTFDPDLNDGSVRPPAPKRL